MPALLTAFHRWWLLPVTSVMLTACVGPDFNVPNAPAVNRYTTTPLKPTVDTHDPSNAGKTQVFDEKQTLPAEWWALYHSPALDALIKRGLAHSPSLAAAKATLLNAKETYRSQVGTAYAPSITAGGGATREQSNAASQNSNNPSQLYNLYNTSVNVSYTLYWGVLRANEASAAQVDYERYQLAAAYLSLTANIVTTAISVASYQAQIATVNALITAEQENLVIIEKQVQLGATAKTTALNQGNLLAQNRALLPPLQNALNQALNSLAVYIGAFPSEMTDIGVALESLTLPTQLPVTLPSQLVEQRPDVLSSQAQLHIASANIGIATANLLPQITLSGSYGNSSNRSNNLFDGNTGIWSFGGQLLQPIFNGGALRANRRASIAAYTEAVGNYQQIVLQAFQNVSDSLEALQTDAQLLQAQQQALDSTRETLAIIQKQYRLGGASYLTVLNANEAYQQAKLNQIVAEAARYSDTAALFQSLGGSWTNASLNQL